MTLLRENLPLRKKAQDLSWASTLKVQAKGEELTCEVEDKPEKQGQPEQSLGLLKQRKKERLKEKMVITIKSC